MPRKARIDAPGALHHIVVRGIARRKLFDDDNDDRNFLTANYQLRAGGAVNLWKKALPQASAGI
jgi:hypothetical protein